MSSSTRTKTTADTPDLSGTKGLKFDKRQFVCDMRVQKNASGASIRVGTILEDEEGDTFVYVVTKNHGRDPDSRQPEYQLGKSFRNDEGQWGEPLAVAPLWSGETVVTGKAEPVKCLIGKDKDKTVKFTFFPKGTSPDGGSEAALFQATQIEVTDDGEPDEFLDD